MTPPLVAYSFLISFLPIACRKGLFREGRPHRKHVQKVYVHVQMKDSDVEQVITVDVLQMFV